MTYSSTLKIETIYFSETSAEFQQTKRLYIFITTGVRTSNPTYEELFVFTYIELGRAIAQAVSRWLPTAAVRGSKPDLGMWDLW
jgi:hypothetical protein